MFDLIIMTKLNIRKSNKIEKQRYLHIYYLILTDIGPVLLCCLTFAHFHCRLEWTANLSRKLCTPLICLLLSVLTGAVGIWITYNFLLKYHYSFSLRDSHILIHRASIFLVRSVQSCHTWEVSCFLYKSLSKCII